MATDLLCGCVQCMSALFLLPLHTFVQLRNHSGNVLFTFDMGMCLFVKACPFFPLVLFFHCCVLPFLLVSFSLSMKIRFTSLWVPFGTIVGQPCASLINNVLVLFIWVVFLLFSFLFSIVPLFCHVLIFSTRTRATSFWVRLGTGVSQSHSF